MLTLYHLFLNNHPTNIFDHLLDNRNPSLTYTTIYVKVLYGTYKYILFYFENCDILFQIIGNNLVLSNDITC